MCARRLHWPNADQASGSRNCHINRHMITTTHCHIGILACNKPHGCATFYYSDVSKRPIRTRSLSLKCAELIH